MEKAIDFLRALKQAHYFYTDSFYLLLFKGKDATTANRIAVINNEIMHKK